MDKITVRLLNSNGDVLIEQNVNIAHIVARNAVSWKGRVYAYTPALSLGMHVVTFREQDAPLALESLEENGEELFGFGQALALLKKGRCVARKGWNGADMHVYREDMLSHVIPGGVFKGERREYPPVLCMYTAQGYHQAGWTPSQADLDAEDWMEIC